MEIGSAIAIVGTVFSLVFGVAHVMVKSKNSDDVGKKLDEISAALISIGAEVKTFTIKQAETGIQVANIEKNTRGEIHTLNQQLQEIYKWRLDHVETHTKPV